MVYQSIKRLAPNSRRTFFLESIRAIAVGTIDTAGNTFFLLYMVKVLLSGEISKSLVVAGGSIGFLIAPLVVQISAGFVISSHKFASLLFLLSSISCALVPNLEGEYAVLFLCLTSVFWNASVPFLTQIYSENYPSDLRGKLFSLTVIFRIVSAAVFAYLWGDWLEADLSNFSSLFKFYSLMLLVSAVLLFKIPSSNTRVVRSNALVEGLNALKMDKVFRVTIISWMFLGFGNLLLYPLRVEFLANPEFGKTYGPADVAFLVSVVPNLTRLVFVLIWGFLFDRIDFFTMRILVNIGFMLGTISFFLSSSWAMLVFAGCLYGVSIAGGDVAWNLWVTKFAPEGQSRPYMSVHTFFTGFRGVIAPITAFSLVYDIGFRGIVCLSLFLMVVGTLILSGESQLFKNGFKLRKRKKNI